MGIYKYIYTFFFFLLSAWFPKLKTIPNYHRSGFTLPRHLQRGNFEEDNEEDHFNGEVYPGMTWKDIAWLKTVTKLPIVIKGIFREEDARIAVQQGVDGIIVSNHGGRQLDSCPASASIKNGVVVALMKVGYTNVILFL